jgi:hypothetical protein
MEGMGFSFPGAYLLPDPGKLNPIPSTSLSAWSLHSPERTLG